MNICHVITRMIIGGAQENTHLSCVGLHDRGHHVTLVTGPESGPEGSLLETARAGGYDVRVVPSLRRAVRPMLDRQARGELATVFRELRPQVVHTHSSKAGVIGRLAARDAGVPLIVHTIHGMSFNRTQRWAVRALYRLLERYCARFTDHIVTVADGLRDQAVIAGLAGPEKFTTIYSGMRTDWFTPDQASRIATRQAWGVEDADVVVGTVARLFRNKGYEQLIPAMAEAARQNPRLRFVWVGDGAQRAEYEARLERLGMRSRVYLTGLIPPSAVAQVLGGIDLLVHASQWEGLPRAAVQSLLMERPVVSFDIDGAPEVVLPGQTGLLVELNDTAGLTAAMLRLAGAADERERMGKAGRELCLARFDYRRMVDELEALYERLGG